MICEQCHRENRQIAKFCKWCGKPLIVQEVLNRMIPTFIPERTS